MQCKPCRYSSRINREGGESGLCWKHRKTKCRLCGQLSAGKPYCVACEHSSDVARWKEESKPTHFDDDHEFLQMQLRKERLAESKYHTHRAVEILFRSLVLAMEALWGGVKEPEAKPEKGTDPKFREAA